MQGKFKKFIAPSVTEKWIKIIHECCFKKKFPHVDIGIHSTDLTVLSISLNEINNNTSQNFLLFKTLKFKHNANACSRCS